MPFDSLPLLIDQYLEYCLTFRGLTPRTIKGYRYNLKYFIDDTQVKGVSEITLDCIEWYIYQGRKEHSWSAKTIRNRILCLRAFLDWCIKRKLLSHNPARLVDLPKLAKRIPHSLTKNQAWELLETTKHIRYYYAFERKRAVAVMALFLFTGLRYREAMDLTLDAVDFENNLIYVRNGKGQKDRTVPINRNLKRYLEDYLDSRNKKGRQTPYFWVSLKKDIKMSDMMTKRLFKKLKAATGIHFSPHMLRHTFATLMIQGGCDIHSLSHMLGHSDIKTTTIYLSIHNPHMTDQMRKHPLSWAA